MLTEMKKIIIPILSGLALIAVSCEKNLDIPKKGVTNTADYYASDADAQAALTNMYANYIDNVAGTEGIDNPEYLFRRQGLHRPRCLPHLR